MGLHIQKRKAFPYIYITPHLHIVCYLCHIRNRIIIVYAFIYLERINAWKIFLLLIEHEYTMIIFSLNDTWKGLRRFH